MKTKAVRLYGENDVRLEEFELRPITSGEILINGFDIFKEPEKAKKCIGYLPEIPPLYTDMTPYEFLMFVAGAKGVKASERKDAGNRR